MTMSSTHKLLSYGLIISTVFTLLVSLVAANLEQYVLVGVTVPFAYPWRLVEPSTLAQVTAWSGYLLHNVLVWLIIYKAQQAKLRFQTTLHQYNWALIAVNLTAVSLHLLQTYFFYDGLAADVPEVTAQGSVVLMLIVVLIIETPRRGLFFGKPFNFKQGFVRLAKKYHGYLFSWAIIYTFWYHPTEGTWGHLVGFFYIFLLMTQGSLIFNRAHINKYWTFTLEFLVLVHGVTVAVFQGNMLWPMFGFGFGAMVVITQMHGLGLSVWVKRLIAMGFVVGVLSFYALYGNIGDIHEVIRIPVVDYLFIFVLYGLYLLLNRLIMKREERAD